MTWRDFQFTTDPQDKCDLWDKTTVKRTSVPFVPFVTGGDRPEGYRNVDHPAQPKNHEGREINMSETKIEWTDKPGNPITEYTPVGAACYNCQARRGADHACY